MENCWTLAGVMSFLAQNAYRNTPIWNIKKTWRRWCSSTIMISCSINFVIHPWEIVLNGSRVANIHSSSRLIKAVGNRLNKIYKESSLRIWNSLIKQDKTKKQQPPEDPKSPPVFFIRKEESLPCIPHVHGSVHLPHCFGEPEFVDVLGEAVHQVISVQSPHPDPCPNAQQRLSLQHHQHKKTSKTKPNAQCDPPLNIMTWSFSGFS